METSILERKRTAVEEIVNCAGNQDRAGVSKGEDAGCGVDREAANVPGGYLNLATVDCLSELEVESIDLRAQ